MSWIAVVLVLMHGSLIVLGAEESKTPLTLEEVYEQSFRPYGFNGTWNTDNDILYSDNNTGNIYLFDVTTKSKTLILNASLLMNYNTPTVTFSFDNSHVLIAYDYVKGFRYSTYQRFDVLEIETGRFANLANGERIPLAKWSPTENTLVYVHDNDIYYKEPFDVGSMGRRLTNSGIPGEVYNGVPDWVYEEEVLSSSSALWFSPDGKHVAFASYNDTDVRDMVIPKYGTPGSLTDQYPSEEKIKYPKAGSPNPIVSLSVVDLSNPSSKLINLQPPIDVIGVDNVLYTVSWRNNEEVVATWTNRVQNESQLVLYNTQGTANYILYQEEPEGWLRVHPPLYYNDYVIILKPQPLTSDIGRVLHPTRFLYKNGALINEKDLTPFKYEVSSMLALDPVRGKLFFTANNITKPWERVLYSVILDDDSHTVECHSCNLYTPEGKSCLNAYGYFSKKSSNYALSCSGPAPMFITIRDTKGLHLLTWEKNQALRDKLSTRQQPTIKIFKLSSADNIWIKFYLPPDFDESKSYPLLINVYAGPGTTRITSEYTYGFEGYMTTNKNVVYATIDGRGSANKGTKLLYSIYRRLGSVEIEDQIKATELLISELPWIDRNRTAIWGWSYGGFATAMALATDTNSVFKCGISVAPVTSWIYYDSIYTERYMGLPTEEDNLKGYYNVSEVISKVEGIRGKKFLLIHGTGDDNVHYQQSLALVKELVNKDIMFQQQSYTDQAHDLAAVTPHLYHTMDRFLSKCLGYSIDV